MFGGATRLWYGQCIRLDPIDFERREWVPHSGWPIGAAELDPYYDRAETIAGIRGAVYDARLWRRFGIADPAFGCDVHAKFTTYMPQPDFTKLFGRRLVRSEAADLLLNAAATCLEMDCTGPRIDALTVRNEDGRIGRIRARAFALCCGGIGNPRLLLASNNVRPDGIGNDRGLVGRFFQDHPSGTTGVVTTSKPGVIQNQFRKLTKAGIKVWPKLALTETAQRRRQILNANALMLYDYDAESALIRAKSLVAAAAARRPAAIAAAGARTIRHVPELAIRAVQSVATGKAPAFHPSRVMLKTHVEQRPDPENRVTLSTERDKLGVPLPKLSWRVHETELATMRAMTEAVGAAFRRLGWGEVTVCPWLDGSVDAARPELEDTFHHHGTTRMASTAGEGVTDAQGLVYGTANLYVAGASLFPTSGYANPTLTIVALAIRLADTLRQRLSESRAVVR